jgi:lipoate-protein ligase A
MEEALLKEARVPTPRTWENQRSVVIGRARSAEFETDLGYCRGNSIPVVRGTTAGGAVCNGPGNLNRSHFFPEGATEGEAREVGHAKAVFRTFASVLVGALQRCGVESEFDPPDRITNGAGKISGMAAYASKDAALCHGTLLVVERLTRPSAVTPGGRYPRSRPRSRAAMRATPTT